MLYDLEIKAMSQVLQPKRVAEIKMSSDTVNEVIVKFDLDENWLSFDVIRAVFENCGSKAKKTVPIKSTDAGFIVVVPWEVLTSVGTVKLYLIGQDIVIKDGKSEVVDRLPSYKTNIIKVLEKVTVTDELTPSGGEFEFLLEKINELTMPSRVQEWLYDARYKSTELDYNFAFSFFKKNYATITYPSGCSAVYKNGILGKNLDWYYNWCMNFVVRTDGFGTRNRTMGLAGGITSLTKQFVESGDYDTPYKLLPFIINEGMNEHKLTVSTNVVPVDETKNGVRFTVPTTETNPDGKDICTLMLVRYLLDNCNSVDDCIDKLVNELNIYSPNTDRLKEELHLLITDEGNVEEGRDKKQVIVEFINNEVIVIDVTDNYPWMTNYYREGAEFYDDGTLNYMSLTDHPQGVYRNNLIAQNYDTIESVSDMMNLMQNVLRYTTAYQDFNWRDEFCANYGEPYGDLTIRVAYEEPERFEPLFARVQQLFAERSRDTGRTWQTCHSAVYDIDNFGLFVVVEEHGVEHTMHFNLDPDKDKLDTYYGMEYDGKYLRVGEDGIIYPIDAVIGSYDDLDNKPAFVLSEDEIITIEGDKTPDEYGLARASELDEEIATRTQDILDVNERIDNISPDGRYLSYWLSNTGLPETNPPSLPFEYKSGDWFRVKVVAGDGGTNYRPTQAQYDGTPSTIVETEEVGIGDVYRYDGTVWNLEHMVQRDTHFIDILGEPTDNARLATALAGKVGFTNYPVVNENVAGVIKLNSTYGARLTPNNELRAVVWDNAQEFILSAPEQAFVGKGTLNTLIEAGYFKDNTKVDKSTIKDTRIYGTDMNGDTVMYRYIANSVIGNTLMYRNGDGQTAVANATQDIHAVPKGQADSTYVAQSNEVPFLLEYADGTSETLNMISESTSNDEFDNQGGEFYG